MPIPSTACGSRRRGNPGVVVGQSLAHLATFRLRAKRPLTASAPLPHPAARQAPIVTVAGIQRLLGLAATDGQTRR